MIQGSSTWIVKDWHGLSLLALCIPQFWALLCSSLNLLNWFPVLTLDQLDIWHTTHDSFVFVVVCSFYYSTWVTWVLSNQLFGLPAGQPTSWWSFLAKILMLDVKQQLFNQCFSYLPAYRYHLPPPCYSIFFFVFLPFLWLESKVVGSQPRVSICGCGSGKVFVWQKESL